MIDKLIGKILRQYWHNVTNTNFITDLVPSKAFIMAAPLPGGTHFRWVEAQSLTVAFTMAEILLSLTIIGVVAAITLPLLTGDINEKIWYTQKKALYTRMLQAIEMLPSMNGYGEYQGEWASGSVTVTTDTAAETFVREGLAKVLKINNICDNQHFQDCGISATLKTMTKSEIDFPKKLSEMNSTFTSQYSSYLNPQSNVDTNAVAFETHNGKSIVLYYNPFCQPDLAETSNRYVQPKMCANFVYDLNGKKGPNFYGKDIGSITVFYSTDSKVVAPIPLWSKEVATDFYGVSAACRSMDIGSRAPSIDELSAIYINKKFIFKDSINAVWSGTNYSSNYGWYQNFKSGIKYGGSKSTTKTLRCVKR